MDVPNEVLKGKPNVVTPIGKFKKETFDLIEVEHGYDVDSNYIWHLCSKTPRRCLPSNNKFLGELVYTYLDPHIPSDCQVEVFFPNSNFDLKILTIKGHRLGKKWNFDDKKVNLVLPEMCGRLSEKLEIPRVWSSMARKNTRGK